MAPKPQQQGSLTERMGQAAGATPATSNPAAGAGIKSLLASPSIKKRFEEVLDKKAPQFMSSIINLVNSEKQLQVVDQMSVIASCMVAASLDLPVDKNLGYAWVVPYKGRASFQMGYKGYIQLALRSGQYAAMNALEIYEGELDSWNRLSEKLELDFSKKKSDAIIGYAGYFELVNGFKKTVYWTREEIEAHRGRFSKSDFGWKNDYDGMALKTVIRNMLSKWGILSIEMQSAYSEDVKPAEETPQDTVASNVFDAEGYVVEEGAASAEQSVAADSETAKDADQQDMELE